MARDSAAFVAERLRVVWEEDAWLDAVTAETWAGAGAGVGSTGASGAGVSTSGDAAAVMPGEGSSACGAGAGSFEAGGGASATEEAGSGEVAATVDAGARDAAAISGADEGVADEGAFASIKAPSASLSDDDRETPTASAKIPRSKHPAATNANVRRRGSASQAGPANGSGATLMGVDRDAPSASTAGSGATGAEGTFEAVTVPITLVDTDVDANARGGATTASSRDEGSS